ncbi:MAG: hypothetical protein KIS73_22520 [Enhydrobacter sp.]|nr:hypothetical protein [Enhydrobacter sp.]
MDNFESLNWAGSKTVGLISEIAVLAPIRQGPIAGERRTYEQRLREAIDNLQKRVQKGTPNELDKVRSIHFGRMIIIRPEQYLVYSQLNGVQYADRLRNDSGQIPELFDDYVEVGKDPGGEPGNLDDARCRSWLLTLVEFDGDLKVYFRDIAQYLGSAFDKIFVNCEDFPGTTDFEQFWLWIRRYQIETALFYPRYRDLSAVRIRQLQEFKRQFDEFVASVRCPTGPRVKSMDELFDAFLRRTQHYASDFPAPGGTFRKASGE